MSGERIDLAEVHRLRAQRGQTVLLFLTDRCPVGCGHCSVDSRRDGPRVTDYTLLNELIEAICAIDEIRCVGVSGGEPFAERRGLTTAAGRITASGKLFIPYTSGYWGATEPLPPWIRGVLAQAACVFLSTDAFHAEHTAAEHWVRAARAIAGHGAWLIVQTLNRRREADAAEDLLIRAFGPQWDQVAEIHTVPLIAHGRAQAIAEEPARRTGREFGRCTVVNSPVVRYDGRIAACCNESVAMGAGPVHLHRRATDRATAIDELRRLRHDPYFTQLAAGGLGPLTLLPTHRDLAERTFPGICRACWALLRRGAPGASPSATPEGGDT